MFRWKKIGRVFDPTLHSCGPWMSEFAQAPSVVLFDSFIRVFFSCRPRANSQMQYVSYSAYVDLDRSNILKVLRVSNEPVISLGGIGEFDEFGTYPISVIKDGKFLRAFYGGWTRCESIPFDVSIGMAISDDDGVSFAKLGHGPVLTKSLDEPFVISGPKIRKFNGLWYLFYIAGRKWKMVEGRPEPVYKIRVATSQDCISWKKLNRDLIESRIEEDEAQASPDVFYSNNRFHMFFCYRYSANYRGKEGGYRIGYAYSDNLVNWTRDDERVGIDVSLAGWDSEMISYPHLFDLDNKIFMVYLGNQVGRYGFGIAELEGQLS
jgi:hypothetical protein